MNKSPLNWADIYAVQMQQFERFILLGVERYHELLMILIMNGIEQIAEIRKLVGILLKEYKDIGRVANLRFKELISLTGDWLFFFEKDS